MSSIVITAGPVFHLRTATASLLLRVGEEGHLELDWFADRLPDTVSGPIRADVGEDRTGLRVNYGADASSSYSLGEAALAWSSLGKGDFRPPGIQVAGHPVLDFRYTGHHLQPGALAATGLPGADGESTSQTLDITLTDPVAGIECVLRWTTFPDSGVITRRTLIRNTGQLPVVLEQAASQLIDLPVADTHVLTFDGSWLDEAQPTRLAVGKSQLVNESMTGSSCSEHHPGLIVLGADTTQSQGWCYGFNLVYSGSHRTSVAHSRWGSTRVVSGINPTGFCWPLAPGEEFCTPEAVTAFSADGLNGLSQQLHRFVNDCIVPARWRRRARPVVFNSWESNYFDFTTDSLIASARVAARLGAEMLVLDDGWFGARHDDHSSLGDWQVNERKLPGGLTELHRRLAELGLELGLWLEPEAVSPDSELYRAHPDWAITAPHRSPSLGRHELLLDLTQAQVRDYLVGQVGQVLDEAQASYVKWDMNRLLSDLPSDGYQHRYQLGLYEVLGRIFGPRPEILLETCSSGGNRFDLAMLTFGPQIWASDCTDPVQRLDIQRGLSYLYPASTVSAHISASPNHQTGRSAPMAFRFAASASCVLGLELDPTELSQAEADELAAAVAWYKSRRELLQFGTYYRMEAADGTDIACCADDDGAVIFDRVVQVCPQQVRSALTVPYADERWYEVRIGQQVLQLPGAALRRGVPRTGRARSLTALIYEITAVR